MIKEAGIAMDTFAVLVGREFMKAVHTWSCEAGDDEVPGYVHGIRHAVKTGRRRKRLKGIMKRIQRSQGGSLVIVG